MCRSGSVGVGRGEGVDTAVVQVTAVVWVQSLAQEQLPHAIGAAKKERKRNRLLNRNKRSKRQ